MDNVQKIAGTAQNMVACGFDIYNHPDVFSQMMREFISPPSEGTKQRVFFQNTVVGQNFQKFFNLVVLEAVRESCDVKGIPSAAFRKYARKIREFCDFLSKSGVEEKNILGYKEDSEVCDTLSKVLEKEGSSLFFDKGSVFVVTL